MACRSCDLKRIYRLFEEKKRREAEEAAKRARKKKVYEPVEAVVETVEEPTMEIVEEAKAAEPVVEESQPEDDFGLI